MKFRLRTLFLVTLIAAIACCFFFVFPDWLFAIVAYLVLLNIPPVSIAGVVYCRGWARAFFVGVSASVGAILFTFMYLGQYLLFGMSDFFDNSSGDDSLWFRVTIFIFLVVIGNAGLMAMGVRWLAGRQRRAARPSTEEIESVPHFLDTEDQS